ncbi:hypothetical protein, partial [Klebsiella pneumoniae]|uniref:hypothetical protein n=1 Tax=Klebsiella pneumoniae TaxID=573 RepID=UPI003531C561
STNDVVASWLLNSMEPKIAVNFTFVESAEEIWRGVRELYGEQFNAARMFQLTQEKSTLKKGTMAIHEYLGKFKNIWDELDIYSPLSTDLLKA